MANDSEKLKADIEDGYTKISNLILEVLALAKMTGVQKGLCMFLFRRTYGWGQKEDEISLKEFAKATDSSKSYVSKQLKKLIKKKIILRTKNEPGKTPAYKFNTRVEQWDKGCVDTQQLNKNATQGLYKRTTQGLNKDTTPEQPSTPDTIGSNQAPKESIKESINKTQRSVIDINNHKRDTEEPGVTDKSNNFHPQYSEMLSYAKQKIVTNVLSSEYLINDDLKTHGPEVVKKSIDLAIDKQKSKSNYSRGDPKNGVDISSWKYIQCFINDARKILNDQQNNKTPDPGGGLSDAELAEKYGLEV